MKKALVYCGALAALAFGACKKEAQQPVAERPLSAGVTYLANGDTLPNIIEGGDTIRLEGACNTFYLDGKCYVKRGGVLVIKQGVTVKGISKPTPAEASALVITRGGRIFADGTETQPIIFTSTVDSVGKWGGVVILGQAPINQDTTTVTIEGIDLPSLPAGVDVHFGGSNSSDNSGRFNYVRIYNAGAAISPNNELNSLTLGGVGSGTQIHHVLAANGADDAFECFGGTVSLRYIIAQSTNDDAFDFDFGYRGAIQFALAVVKSVDNTFNGDANGIESDNDGTGSSATPQTRPVISNMTIIGGNSAAVTGTVRGTRFRRNSSGILYNSIIMGYNTGYAEIAIQSVRHNLIQAFTTGATPALDASNKVWVGGNANDSIRLRNPFGSLPTVWMFGQPNSPATFDARPDTTVGSPAATGAVFNEAPINAFVGGSGMTAVSYRGAFDPAAANGTAWMAFALDNTCN
ncbi:hypothetical protein [Chitinophaga japonensis]|uniref:T9SS C-terminal target domain-containing protein n=1 Tax=Chitinophaga japonensis TaxID=104662 RepID=A0A562T3U1_CHIJA|nr:hypothetical protein [Chitinophaga japonensis]TWI88211.1 hypothetical protein LX66_2294 [Chitinophaga japonensis]